MLACARELHVLQRMNPTEGSAECFHSYAKVAADYVFGCGWKTSVIHPPFGLYLPFN